MIIDKLSLYNVKYITNKFQGRNTKNYFRTKIEKLYHMPDLTLTDQQILWLIAATTFITAGSVKGVVGIGLPTIVVGVLAQFIDPRQAIVLLIFPGLVSNAWQFYRSKKVKKLTQHLWPFATIMATGIWICSQFAAKLNTETLVLFIGIIIVLFVISNFILKPITIPKHLDIPAQIGTGTVAGIMGGLTSIWATPMLLYLMSCRLPKDEFVGAMGFLIFIGMFSLCIGYWQAGLITPAVASFSASMIIPTWLGFLIGEQARKYLDAEQFRKALLVVFLLMGANLIRRGLI